MSVQVLVLDAAQRSALAVTRSLGRVAHVTTAEASSNALAGCSRYSSAYIESPSAEHAPEAYIEWIKDLTKKQHFDLIVPVTEITSQLLLMNAAKLSQVKLPFAAYKTVMSLADKGNLTKLAMKLGVNCPESTLFNSAAELDIKTLSFPLVLKPCLSKIFADGKWIATAVQVLHSQADLEKALAKNAYFYSHAFMLQEFIPGHGAGVFCLYNHGTPLAFFAHQRLREKPPQGGVSVLSESVAINPQLQQDAIQLLDKVKWHGVAMVEFRIAPNGTAYLMEVNTRFWGSLQLAIDAGVDFPRLLMQAELGEKPALIASYRIGQRLRWLLGDVDSLYLYLKARYSLSQKMIRILQFFTPRFFHCKHEVNRLNDFGPAWYECKTYIKQVLGRA